MLLVAILSRLAPLLSRKNSYNSYNSSDLAVLAVNGMKQTEKDTKGHGGSAPHGYMIWRLSAKRKRGKKKSSQEVSAA